jgi:ketosteroid isomerase-like protein
MRAQVGVVAIAAVVHLWTAPLAAAQPFPAKPIGKQVPETAIRAALEKWTADFNAGNAEEICDLFASELRYDYRGHPERNYDDLCGLLHRTLNDRAKHYAYALDIKEMLVASDTAIVRLVWTLTIRSNDARLERSTETGMDVFRKQEDGSWKIIRYIAYED